MNKQEILDSELLGNRQINFLRILGIGILIWLILGGFGYILIIALRDILVVANVSAIACIIISLCISLVFKVAGLYYFFAWFKKGISHGQKNYFILSRNLIIIFIISQLLGFAYSFWVNSYLTETYYNQFNAFHEAFSEQAYLWSIDPAGELLLYIITAILVLRAN